MKPNFNLPPGVTRKDIEPPSGFCEECGEPLHTDAEYRLGLCREHLKIVEEELPE